MTTETQKRIDNNTVTAEELEFVADYIAERCGRMGPAPAESLRRFEQMMREDADEMRRDSEFCRSALARSL